MGQIIEADEQGLLRVPVDMIGTAQPHGRYIVEVVGKKLIVGPEPTEEQRRQAYAEWLKEWDELSEEIGKVWPAGLSAVDAVAEQRR